MTNLPTPDQLKAVARDICALEKERLGTSLPRSTVLNTLTRAFGLGQSFAAYTSSQRAEASPDAPVEISGLIFVPNAQDDTRDLPDIGLDDIMIAEIADHYGIDFCEAMHGFETIWIGKQATRGHPDTLRRDLETAIQPLLEALEEAVRDDDIEGPIRHLAWAGRDNLYVNFRYHDNDQVVTGTVPRDAWIRRAAAGLSDEEAILLLAGDIEIEGHVRPHDITVEDVFESVEFHSES